MSAISQMWPNRSGSPDLAVVFAAVEAFPGSLAVVDSRVVLYANPAWARMFELVFPSQIQGRAVEDFIPRHLFHTPANGRSDSGGNCSTGELVHLRPDGRELALMVACAGFRVRGKEFQVVSASDARLQSHAEADLREAQRLGAVGRLAGGVAHDFNNLLTGIMLYCDLLIAELEKDSRSLHHAREMRMAGEHGAKLVQQLLAVARPQSVESRVFAVNEVITGVEELLARLIGENIVLNTSLAGDLCAVRMDPAHVQQILLNLVLNARDAMPEGGHITLATRNCTWYLQKKSERGSSDDEKPQLVPCVELAVSDTGCGMDSETLGRAFEPFFTTKESGRGNGLGLDTACRLAKMEGGTILAESQPGRGTRVSLWLPCVNQKRVDPDSVLNPARSSSERSISKDSRSSGPKSSI